ncbi:MAG TPA: carboxypeptidase-like regulatory domain-containing protein [Acidobacteriaceae bacterium]|nr:carboxypeptidase-like regulatory domain-containing protein [Acidobacteriaceae bacterium]
MAQTERGGIAGQVTDDTGAILPDAAVVLKNEATGAVQTAKTNSDGNYVFQDLNPGSYTITVNREGFKKAEHVHTVVDVNQTNQQNISLAVGATSETVEVTTGIQQLQTNTATLGLVVEERSIEELPLVYSNPFTLETLAPGLLVSGVNPNIHAYDSSTATVSVNGSVLNSMEYRLDGAPDNRIRLSAYTPSTEFIGQYKVETSSYDATEGHSSGGFVNTSLKSGTNQFHGVAFGSYQNPDLNTNYWHIPGSSAPAKASWMREGAAVGGPIKRDKWFFFAGYEHSQSATPNVQLLTVPSKAERGETTPGYYDFSELYALDSANPPGTKNKFQLYDPTSGVVTTGGACGSGKTCIVRSPIPGNLIPAGAVSAIAKAALKYYPEPNTAPNSQDGGNFSYSKAEPDHYYAYIVRSDFNISNRQQIYGHWVRSRRLQPAKNTYFAPVSGTSLTYQNKGVALGYTFTINPQTVLEAHLTWTRFVNQNTVTSQGKLNPTSIGMPSYLVDGLGPNAQAFPRIDITGDQSLNSDNGVLSHDDVTLGSVQVSRLWGKHFVRMGYEYRMYNTNAGITTQGNGRYQNNGSYATATSSTSAQSIGFGLAQFLYGLPNSSAVTINSDLASRSNYMAEWVQDDWKPVTNLTVNLGLRFEYEGPNNERNQKANTYFDFSAPNTISQSAAKVYKPVAIPNLPAAMPAGLPTTGGLRFLGDPATPLTGTKDYQPQVINMLPRVGLSYQFARNTVVRAGFGIFDDSLSTFFLSGGNSGSTSTFLLPQQGFTQATSQSGIANTAPGTGQAYAYEGPDGGYTLANPFPNGIQQPTGNSLGLETYVGQAVTFQPLHPKTPYNMRWSFDIQRQFGSWLADIAYVGNHGVHLPIQQEFNAIPRQYLSTYTAGYDLAENTAITQSSGVNNPFYQIAPNTVSLGTSKTIAVNQLLRPYPQFTSVSAFETSGMSIYHSFQSQLTRRFTHGASLTAAFTWSKSMDATDFLNVSDPQPWYGISANDRTFRFATSGIYQLPFGPGRDFVNNGGVISQIIGGWQVQGVYQVQSGEPLEFDGPSLQTSGTSLPVFLGQGDPSSSAWGRSGFKASSTRTWFNTGDWATKTGSATGTAQQAGVYGTQYQIRTLPERFDGLRSDFMNQLDAAVQRNFSLEKLYHPLSLQIRLDLVNALNHPVLGGSGPNHTVVTDWTSSTFGQVTAQENQPRIYQFEAFVRF